MADLAKFKQFLCSSLNQTYFREVHQKMQRAAELFDEGDRQGAKDELQRAVQFIEMMEELIKPGKRVCRVCGKVFIGRYADVVCSEECFQKKYAALEIQDDPGSGEDWDCFR